MKPAIFSPRQQKLVDVFFGGNNLFPLGELGDFSLADYADCADFIYSPEIKVIRIIP